MSVLKLDPDHPFFKEKFTEVFTEDRPLPGAGSFIQVLAVNNFYVESQVFAYKQEGNHPTVTVRIQLEGKPYGQGMGVQKAELYFFSDERMKFKAFYDPEKKCIFAFYPISNFEKTFSLLKSNIKPNAVLLQYYESSSNDSIEVTLRINGNLQANP